MLFLVKPVLCPRKETDKRRREQEKQDCKSRENLFEECQAAGRTGKGVMVVCVIMGVCGDPFASGVQQGRCFCAGVSEAGGV